MKIHACNVMRRAEQELLDSGAVGSDELMQAAIESCYAQLLRDPQFTDAAGRYSTAIVYAGTGKNAGDAIGLAARMGFEEIVLRLAGPVRTMAPETQLQVDRLPSVNIAAEAPYLPPEGAFIIDGLLGSGAHGLLRPEYAALVEELNSLRSLNPFSITLAVDIPTGLQAVGSSPVVRADATLAIGCVKTDLVADGAEDYVGRLICAPLPEVELPESAQEAADPEMMMQLLPQRRYSCYKNRAGRVCIIAGSPGYTGAAELCAEAALMAGAGLVELYCLPSTYGILASRIAAEVMVRPVQSYAEVDATGANALLIGPGLGKNHDAENLAALRALAEQPPCPLVLDADGLNLTAEHGWRVSPRAILTPHPGEMKRLFPMAAQLSRAECAAAFVRERPCTLMLKGARSIITDGTHTCYNTTGGPYMANGGQGDVLSGVIAALVGQGLEPMQAATLGAYLCGSAATKAFCAANRPLSVRASLLLHYLTTPS